MATSDTKAKHDNESAKKPYEEPYLEEREGLLQITESGPPIVPISEGPIPP
jgi:hypothetical protein